MKKIKKLKLLNGIIDNSGCINPEKMKALVQDFAPVIQPDGAKNEAMEVGTVSPLAPSPSKKKRKKIETLYYHRDTSGSIDPTMIKDFLQEMSQIVQAERAREESVKIDAVSRLAPSLPKKRM